MTRALILAAVAAPLLLAGAAQAQTYPLPPPASAWDQHRYQADQNRYEMDRLRQQADQREATIRQLELESRLNRMDLERRRTVDPYVPSQPPALRSPEDERASRQSATERRQATEAGVGQIDAWLDRRPN
jgi:Spy/CpxP family protein refolding chaperone